MNKFEYKNLTPFKWFVLENFPFIEADFDALTEWQLFCKLGKEMNKIINSQNIVGEQAENLTNAFIELQNYVNNYFDNLDVQEEINNKLNIMATDGTLENIINQEIFGNINNSINELNKEINDTNKKYERNALYIGNSYTEGVGSTNGSNGLFNLTKDLFNNAYKKIGSGTGFLPYKNHENDTFINLLDNAITDVSIDNNSITDVIVIGAWGDSRAYRELSNVATFNTNISIAMDNFVNKIKQNFPNVNKISYAWAESVATKNAGGIEEYPHYFSDTFTIHNIFKYFCPRYGIQYLGWIGFNFILKKNFFSTDMYHPNDTGYKALASYFKSSYSSGVIEYLHLLYNSTNIPSEITEGSTNNFNIMIFPDRCVINIYRGVLNVGATPQHGSTVKIFDFLEQDYQLPITGEKSLLELGTFKQIGSISSNIQYDSKKDVIGQLRLVKDAQNLGNTYLEVQTVGPSLNIDTKVTTAFVIGGTYEYSLEL